MTKTILNVKGMSCASCIERVSQALAIDGVTKVDVRIEQEAVSIEHAPRVSAEQLVAALGEAGYKASLPARDPRSHV